MIIMCMHYRLDSLATNASIYYHGMVCVSSSGRQALITFPNADNDLLIIFALPIAGLSHPFSAPFRYPLNRPSTIYSFFSSCFGIRSAKLDDCYAVGSGRASIHTCCSDNPIFACLLDFLQAFVWTGYVLLRHAIYVYSSARLFPYRQVRLLDIQQILHTL